MRRVTRVRREPSRAGHLSFAVCAAHSAAMSVCCTGPSWRVFPAESTCRSPHGMARMSLVVNVLTFGSRPRLGKRTEKKRLSGRSDWV